MANLVQSLGEDYIREFFSGALFSRDDMLYHIRSCRNGVIEVNAAGLNETTGWRQELLPHSALESFKDISWPKLGYRNLMAGRVGNVAAYVTSQRSVMRGLRQDLLEWRNPHVASHLNINPWEHHPSAGSLYQLRQVFRPTFYSYSEGMTNIKAGKWCSFALNEDIAVAISSSAAGEYCDILFRDKVVGHVKLDGDIHMSNKVIKRSTLRRLFSE